MDHSHLIKPELLSPAGDKERLEMAVAYGADAVYLAGNDFGMRAFAGNFDQDGLREAVRLCHAHGVKVYVACNTMARNNEVSRLPDFLAYLNDLQVDAVIAADVGTLMLCKKHAPNVDIHISTQAGITNYEMACAWHELGASRVILARELSMDEIRELRSKTPKDLEIEAFVHGAMCVSYSGRCLLSNYMTGRDASRGACAQPCRYKYALMEEKRPGQYFPIFEEAGETFILNSKDMCMIDHIPELIESGISSFKIEGRAKSAYYAAIATTAYRHAIDAAVAGKPLESEWRDEVEKISHRHYSTGFYYGYPGQYTEDSRYIRDWQVVGMVESCNKDGLAVISLRNKFSTGDELEVIGPGISAQKFIVPEMEDMEGFPLLDPKTPQMRFKLQLPLQVPPLSFLRACRPNS